LTKKLIKTRNLDKKLPRQDNLDLGAALKTELAAT